MVSRALLIVLAATLGVQLAHAQGGSDWPMFRGDASHTGRSLSDGPELPSPRWQIELGAPAYASPAVGPDGTVYAASTEVLFAYGPDGAEQWSHPLSDFTVASPAVGVDDLVVIASTDGTMLAVDATTGAERWVVDVGGELWASPTIGPAGTVFVATSEGRVYALDPDDGAAQWRQQVPEEVLATPALHDGRLYVVDSEGTLVVMNAETGALEQSFALGAEVVSSPTVDADGIVYVGGLDGTMYAIDPFAGITPMQWNTFLGGEIISSPALGTDGTLYVGSTDQRLFALDAANGQVRWTAPLEAPVLSSPALDAAGFVYVGTADTLAALGRIVALGTADGSVQWSYGTVGPTWSSPALSADGHLLAASVGTEHASGQLYRIEPAALRVATEDEAVAGMDHPIDVSPATDFSPTGGELFYRPGGSDTYASIPLAATGSSSFTASIPGASVTLRGLEYYVTMTDGERTVSLPTSQPDVRPLIERVRVEQMELPRELPVRGFSMISVPADVAQPAIADVLADDYSVSSFSSWRLFRWIDGAYHEFPALSDTFEPGTAFFLIHRSGARFTVEQMHSVDTSVPFVVTLQPGWNQVGVPFAFAVDLADVAVRGAPADAVREVAYFDGEQMVQGTLQNPASFPPLLPWHGYFFHNTLPRPVDIAFLPDEAPTESASTAAAIAPRAADRDDTYRMRLSARSLSGTSLDTYNWLGLRPDARSERDPFDQQEAPQPGEHLRLSLVDGRMRYAVDMRPAPEDGQRWHLELERTPSPKQAEWVEVTLEETRPRPAGYDLYVVDEEARQTVPVIDGQFRIQVGGERTVRHLSVVLGTPAYAADALAGVSEHHSTFFLDQNAPNPFSASTTIPYSLAQPDHVTLEVFNVMGQRVATLVDGRQEAGRHAVTWVGRSDAGRRFASGLYVYRLRIGAQSLTRTMVLLH